MSSARLVRHSMPKGGDNRLAEPRFCGAGVCKHLQVVGITDLLARVDVDEDCQCRSLLSFRRPQCISLRSVNVRSMLRSRSTPIRECITKSVSAASIRQPIAVCHSSRFCSAFGSF
jgi:hypothetical protein